MSLVRTTIEIPDDLHRAVTAIAHDRHQSLSKTVAELMRLGLRGGAPDAAEPGAVRYRNGVSDAGEPIRPRDHC